MSKSYECSSKGDKKFSALYARIGRLGDKTIEYIYQVQIKGYNSIKEGKGKPGKLHSYEKQKQYYENLWKTYLLENPELLEKLLEITETHILTDMFAKPNTINQADALMSIANKIRKGDLEMSRKKLSDVEDKGSDIVGIGQFEMEIIKVESKTSSKGNPMVQITLECEDGIIWDKLVLTEPALGFVKRYLSAIGYDIDDLDYDVVTKGKKKGHVTKFYMTDEDGDEQEYQIDELILGESVLVTTKSGDKSYPDPVSGDTITVANPTPKVSKIEPIEED